MSCNVRGRVLQQHVEVQTDTQSYEKEDNFEYMYGVSLKLTIRSSGQLKVNPAGLLGFKFKHICKRVIVEKSEPP